jgi:hypothetical protein
MKGWKWGLLALPIIGLVLVLALFDPGSLGTPESSAAAVPQLAIDLVQDSGWCNTIDSTANVPVGNQHQAAICLLNVGGYSASDFGIQVLYNSSRNSCSNTGQTGAGLDANPDFVVSPVGGYNCSNSGLTYPSCGAGVAFIGCNTVDDSVILSGNWAIAVITWTASAAGDDDLSFGTASLYSSDGENILRCPGANCLGATVTKLGPATATPTPTPVPPTETPTPLPTATFTPLPTPYADIDKIEDTGWCDTVDAESTEVVGASHSLAVCAHNMPYNIAGFDLHIAYDSGLDGCTEIDCTDGTCVNDNPELAAALGAGWDCSTSGQPVCNVDSQAYIHCNGPASIKSGALAVLNLDVVAAGIDNVRIDSLVLYNDGGLAMAECGPGDGAPGMDCFGATDTKVEASPTPTATETPVPSPTPTFTPTPTVWAFIDKNIGNDCNPATKQSQSTEIVGETHSLALCLANVPTQIEGFSFTIDFNADLDQCVERLCPGDDTTCLDSNPDANAGVTTFGTSLGPDWSCRIEGPGPPFCGSGQVLQTSVLDGDSLVGFATMSCERSQDGFTAFGTSFLDHITLATVDLKVIAAGTDHVVISSLDVWGNDDVTIGQCGAILADVNANTVIEGQMPCIGATDTKTTGTIRHRTPTPKPTATRMPTQPPATATAVPPPLATPTPLGGVGTQLVPPETGSGSTGGGFSWLLALLAGTAGIAALAGGGFYLRFARRRAR